MRKVLGRGLETLLPPGAEAAPTGLREIEIDRIEPNRQQPRRRFDPGLLGELVASIKENGILQPLIVRRHGSAYAEYRRHSIEFIEARNNRIAQLNV